MIETRTHVWMLVAVVALVAVLAMAGGAPDAKAAATCSVSDVHNTVRIDASAPQGVVTAGSDLNGTAGFAWFTGLSLDGEYLLVGPDGSTVGPEDGVGSELFLEDVPFCKTGTWTLLDISSGLPVTRFETADDPGPASGPGTVDVDEPVPDDPARTYDFGDVDYSESYVQCGVTGPNDVFGYPLTSEMATRAKVDWVIDLDAAGGSDVEWVRVALEADAENQTAITMQVHPESGSGNVSVVPGWSAPRLYDVDYTVWEKRQGEEPEWRCGGSALVHTYP